MDVIRRGNIENYNFQKELPDIYMGSGDMGASFDKFGTTDSLPDMGFMHGDIYTKDMKYNMDRYVLPIKMKLTGVAEDTIIDYRQKLDLYDGILTTAWHTDHYCYQSMAGFHTEKRDVFAVAYEWEGKDLPVISFVTTPDYEPDHDIHISSRIEKVSVCGEILEVKIQTGTTEAVAQFQILGDAKLVYDEDKVSVLLEGEKRKAVLLMGLSKAERKEAVRQQIQEIAKEDPIASVAASWHRKWKDSRIAFDGNEDLLKLFYRSVFHILCSFSENSSFIAPPMGWAGKAWRFHFPQDFGYIAPVLLRLGYVDIMKAKIEMYVRYIENLRENTRRIYGCDGVLWTWEFPIGNGKDIFPNGEAPNIFAHEIHNSVYPAKMAWETACFARDPEWSREYAWKIIKESADFFVSGAEFDGKTWDINIQPSMGQDEMGGFGQKNYICALYAARYTLAAAIQAAEEWQISYDKLDQCKKILKDGLAFNKLIHPDLQIYMNYEGDPAAYELHQMKHPIPLNPISFIPVGELNQYEKNAYERRYDLCVPIPAVYGWTLVDIILASAHLGDQTGFWEGIELLRTTGYVDADWSVCYESGRLYWAYPYITSEGLLCDAVLNGIVCEFWGDIRYHGLSYENVKYKNLHLKDGSVISN